MEAIETQIENGLQILDQKEAELTQLSQEFIGLTINGLEDKAGFKAVREGRITIKNARVGVEKAGKALRENAVKFSKRVIEREKELIAIISPVELSLEEKEDAYLALQEQARVKKEREENERIQKRVDALAQFNHAADLYELKIMEEENFQALLGHAEAEFLKEQARVKEQNIRIAAEIMAEQERAANERAELTRQKAEQDKRDAEFKADQEIIKRDQEARENALRAEREKLEKEKREHEEKIRIEQAKKEAAEKAIADEKERVRQEAELKAERELIAKREAERQEALKPDKQKILAYCDELNKLPGPVVSTDAAKRVLQFLFDGMEDLIKETETMTKKL